MKVQWQIQDFEKGGSRMVWRREGGGDRSVLLTKKHHTLGVLGHAPKENGI